MRLKRVGLQGLVTAAVLGATSVALAVNVEPDGSEGAGGGTIISQELKPLPLLVTIAIFLCLVLVLGKFAWKPILSGLKTREKAIRDSIEAAQKAREDAERSTRELEARISEAQRQAAVQLQQAKVDAQKLADNIKAQAEAESAALKDRTLRDIESAKQQALTDINSRAADLGIAVARKILQRNINVEDQGRLVDESLAELGTSKL